MIASEAELAHARQLLLSEAGTAGLPAGPDSGPPARLAWALKQACYQVWNREPRLATRAAELLNELSRLHPRDTTVLALADWIAGIAAIVGGNLNGALTLLESAASIFERNGDARHAGQARVPCVMVLAMLGRPADAECAALTALQQLDAAGDDASAGKVELNLGTLLFRQDRHADAAVRYRAALARFERVGDAEQSINAGIGLANALTWQLDLEPALAVLLNAARQAVDAGHVVLHAQALGSIGQIEINRGRTEAALPALARAALLLDQAGAPSSLRAEAELALAEAYLAVQLLPEAAQLAARVAALGAQGGLLDEQARAWLLRGLALARLGESDRAATDLDQARQFFERQDNPAGAALAGLEQARLLLRGDAARAHELAVASAATFSEFDIPIWQAEAQTLRAQAQAALGKPDAARAGFEAVLQCAPRAPGAEWLARLGLADLALGRADDGGALAQIEAALLEHEEQLARLPGDEFRMALASARSCAFDRLIAIRWRLTQPRHKPQADATELWRAMERSRARSLAIETQAGHVAGQHAANSPATDPQHEQSEQTRHRLAWLRQQAERALASGAPETAAWHAQRARTLEAGWLEQQRRDALLDASAPAMPGADMASMPQLARRLAHDEAWVQYHLLGDEWIALVLTRERATWHSGVLGGLTERVAALRFQIDSMRGRPRTLERHAAQLLARTRHHLHQLYLQLWQPLEDSLRGCNKVALAAHQMLHYVPFCALHDGENWLLQRFELRSVSSATARLHAAPRPWQSPGRVVVVGAGGAGLPHADAEARTVAERFGDRATLLLGADATVSALRAAMAEPADLLHIACHAEFRADSPYFSALRLHDGDLSVRDLARLPLRGTQVVLSACETGQSRVAPGDELLGLVRGCALAGASGITASQWAVDDGSTGLLMQGYYDQLTGGAPASGALRLAQRALAEAGEHPFFWAPFVQHSLY